MSSLDEYGYLWADKERYGLFRLTGGDFMIVDFT